MNGISIKQDKMQAGRPVDKDGSVIRVCKDKYSKILALASRIRNFLGLFRRSFRYKLLLLVLLPLLFFVPMIIGFALYQGYSFARQQLRHKVNSDINMTMLAFTRKQSEYLRGLAELAESHTFYSAFVSQDKVRLSNLLQTLKVTDGLDFVHLLDLHGKWLYDDSVFSGKTVITSMIESVIRTGQPKIGLEIYSTADLLREHQELISKAGLSESGLLPDDSTANYQGMILREIYPIVNDHGQIIALLEGGVLLNDNTYLVSDIKSMVYGPQTEKDNRREIVSIILGRSRIASNLDLPENIDSKSIHKISYNNTRDSSSYNSVLNGTVHTAGGQYLCAYMPLKDYQGKKIGLLETGYLSAPLLNAYMRDIHILALLLLLIVIITGSIVILGARRIFKPIERIAEVIRSQEEGIDQRIGQIQSRDEIGTVARRFDHMLDMLHEQNATIRQAAEGLERQVRERTRELQLKNDDLKKSLDILGKTRQQLVWAEKFAALGQLTAGMAHEINNPTAVILGNMDVIKQELGERSGELQTEIDLIYAQIDRIRNIIDKLLKYSRSSPINTTLQEVNVNQLIKDSLLLIRHELAVKHADVYTLFEDGCMVSIAPQELQQVLVNLLINAVYAIEDRGIIEIMTLNTNEHEVCIKISDNGKGIDPFSIDKIFDPFYTTKSDAGTGLGLSISYGLVHRYGGRLEVDSIPGQGCTFSVNLRKIPVLAPKRQLFFELYSHDIQMRGISNER